MKKPVVRKLRCAVYTRKSSEEGLDMEFNSLDAQREACSAYTRPASARRAGSNWPNITMTAVSRVARWSDRHCGG